MDRVMQMETSTAPLGDRRFALLIAVSQYADPSLSRLRAPASDSVALRDLLADPEIGGFDVTSVFDEKAQGIRLALEEFLSDRSPDDVVLVYLSSHGLVDVRRRLYFAARDTLKNRLAASGVEAHWVLDQLEECRARRQVVILDCCFSGAFAQGAKGDPDLALGERLMGQGRGRVVLTASRSTEYSFEGEPVEGAPAPGSVFTSALVEGITSGNADADGDGYISVDDAYAYAFETVRRAGYPQTPQRWLYGAEGSIVLARRPVEIGSTTHTGAAPTSEPAATDTRPVASEPPTFTTSPSPAPASRSRRWRLALAAALVASVASFALLMLLPKSDQPGGTTPQGTDGSSSPTSGQFDVSAPWRLIVRDNLGANDVAGCTVTTTDSSGTVSTIKNFYDTKMFHMHRGGTIYWEASDPGCEVIRQPGAGVVTLPFTSHPCCQGDTDAFDPGDQVSVEVVDFSGSSSCLVNLNAVVDGRTLDFATLEEGDGPVVLDTFGESPVYVADPVCRLKFSSVA
jgi:hypothetical protein